MCRRPLWAILVSSNHVTCFIHLVSHIIHLAWVWVLKDVHWAQGVQNIQKTIPESLPTMAWSKVTLDSLRQTFHQQRCHATAFRLRPERCDPKDVEWKVFLAALFACCLKNTRTCWTQLATVPSSGPKDLSWCWLEFDHTWLHGSTFIS